MSPQNEIDAFIRDYAKDLQQGAAAIFAGAGLSRGSGFVDWAGLLEEIAADLGLDIKLEHDLIAVAQYHFNEKGGHGLSKKIVEEFSGHAEHTDVHDILARLPIHTYWTTNYDTLIEQSLRSAYRIPDIKRKVDDLSLTRPKSDAVVYKMHGDVESPSAAVLYKAQYEAYHRTHAPFITALSGDLVSKTFLFIGFSFSDPNLDYVFSRLHAGAEKRTHYCFIKEETQDKGESDKEFQYRQRRQALRIKDLKRFGIIAILIDSYADIPRLLLQVESRFRKKTVLISGSAEDYGDWTRIEGQMFLHNLSAACVKADLRVVNGFGWGVGSAIINGALEAVYSNPGKYSEDQLIVKPFPQYGDNLPALWEAYRKRMVPLAGIAIFVFGNKLKDGVVVTADGVRREFELSIEHGLVPIPVGATGFIAYDLWAQVMAEPEKYYKGVVEWIVPYIKRLGDRTVGAPELIKTIIEIIKRLGK